MRADRPDAVARRGRRALAPRHARPAACLRPLALAQHPPRHQGVQDGRCRPLCSPGRACDRAGRRAHREGKLHGDGRAHRRGARRVQAGPGAVPLPRGQRAGCRAGPRLRRACADAPWARRRGQGVLSECDQRGPGQPRRVHRARQPGAALRASRGSGQDVRRGQQDRPVVRARPRVPRACAHGEAARGRAGAKGVRGGPRAGSPRHNGAHGEGPGHGGARPARRGGQAL